MALVVADRRVEDWAWRMRHLRGARAVAIRLGIVARLLILRPRATGFVQSSAGVAQMGNAAKQSGSPAAASLIFSVRP